MLMLTIIALNMDRKSLPDITYEFTQHRNTNVILCRFPYDPARLQGFRKEFPSARWSRTFTAWYLPDTVLYRSRLHLPLPELGDNWLPKLYEHNKAEFVKFRNALTQRTFSPHTIQTYLGEFAQLLILLKNYPVDQLSSERLNAYFLYCTKTLKHSEAQIYSRMNAVKSYFRLVLQRQEVFDQVIKPKSPQALPKVLSKPEILRLFQHTANIKHLLLLKMAYGMGLRVSELVALKVAHVDLDRMQVHIVAAKGKKDRYVHFPQSLRILYLDYLKAFQPRKYVFEGQFADQYTTRSAQAVFRTAMNKAGIRKSVGIHGLRHSYATHLLEAGTDMVFIQKLLGHRHIRTTEIYARVSQQQLLGVQSPLDTL